MLAAIEEHQPALVFIAYPNNPTGNLFDDGGDRAHARRGAPGSSWSTRRITRSRAQLPAARARRYPNLLVMRTLSKSGLAGLRLGYRGGAPAWLAHVDKVRLPYNVSVLTQLVAEEALQHRSLLDEQAAAISAERARLYDELARDRRARRRFPSDANFILFRTGRRRPDVRRPEASAASW